MKNLRAAFIALFVAIGMAPVIAAPPPPVPSLPDASRLIYYTPTNSTGPFSVPIAIYGDGTDYGNWLEVRLNGVKLIPGTDWTFTSASGPLSNLPRPITDGSVTLTSPRTGQLGISGARRPRRVSQFSEQRGVTARDLNQSFSDLTAQNREMWDKQAATIVSQPGVVLGNLPSPATCAGRFIAFDVTGLNPVCLAGAGSGNVVGPPSSANGNLAVFSGTSGALIADAGGPITPLGLTIVGANTGAAVYAALGPVSSAGLNFIQSGTGAVGQTFDQLYRGKIVTPEMFGATCALADSGPAIQLAINYAASIGAAVEGGPCYNVVTPIVDNSGVTFKGNRSYGGTRITFVPTINNQIAYRVRSAGNIIVGGSLENVNFYTPEATFTKTAVQIEDVSNYKLRSIVINGATIGTLGTAFWGGGGNSVGIRTNGREFVSAEDIQIAADRPFVIDTNPNSYISTDYFRLTNLYLLANGTNSNLEFTNGTQIQHMSVNGLSCVLGLHCVYSNDTTSGVISYGLSFRDVGSEQGSGAVGAGYAFYLKRNVAMSGLVIDGFQLWDGARSGAFLTNVFGASFENVKYASAAPSTCFNVDGTVSGLSITNSEVQGCTNTLPTAGATASGQNLVTGDITQSGYALPRNSRYVKAVDDRSLIVNLGAYVGNTSGLNYLRGQPSGNGSVTTLPNTTGTIVNNATAPLVANATTGNISCPTCLSAGSAGGDLTGTYPNPTLATVNSNVGSFGSSTAIPNFTVDGKGRITAAGSAAVIAPAGTLTGATLASGVTASSLTSFGASPALSGTPTAPTAAVDTSTTQIASTAFVIGQAGTATPIVNGTGAAGISKRYAPIDHVHPTDTSRAPLASPTFTGVPAAPTATTGTNTTQIATTQFVNASVAAATAGVSSINSRTGVVNAYLQRVTATFVTDATSSTATVYQYKLTGPGGGGGGSNSSTGAAGGAGGGGTCIGQFSGVGPGVTVTITPNTGGAGGSTVGGNGSAGSGSATISATGMTTVTATAGNGGSGTTSTVGGIGAGGSCTTGTGVTSIAGGSGYYGVSNASAVATVGGWGGASIWGQGGINSNPAQQPAGGAAASCGGGGGGASFTTAAGGAGANGCAEITWLSVQ